MNKGDGQMKIDIKQTVKKYYGEELQGTSDLKTNACCTLDSFPDYIRKIIPLLNDEIKTKYYGCGSPIPLCIEGLKVLDVGCGRGEVMRRCADLGARAYGIDYAPVAVQMAHGLGLTSAVDPSQLFGVFQADAKRVPFSDGVFDREDRWGGELL